MLPSYDEVTEVTRVVLKLTLPEDFEIPQKRPTRRGLARYIADLSLDDTWTSKEWVRIWASAVAARDILLKRFHVKIPRDTFKQDKARVRWLLQDPEDRKTTYARRAYRWASN